ncbi:MAG: hypothetical protein CSA58_09860 [Micrococcales bacterium]|nr:MAG: hypothetical protein CSA58_09860 [Micrococcales bacterium]
MKTTTTRSIAVSAALALCLGAGALSAAESAASPGWAVGTAVMADPGLTVSKYSTVVVVNGGTPVNAGNGQDITVQYPQGVDVSGATVTVGGTDAAGVATDDSAKTVSFTAGNDLVAETGQSGEVVITGLSASWHGEVAFSFLLATTADGPDPGTLNTALDLTVTLAPSTMAAGQSTVTLPALDSSLSAPAWSTFTAGDSAVTDSASAKATGTTDLAAGTVSFDLSSAATGDGTLDVPLTNGTEPGWSGIHFQGAVTIEAADSGPGDTPPAAATPEQITGSIGQDLLGGELPDAAAWQQKLQDGEATPGQVALEVTRSDAWREKWIQRNYQDYLGRAGTAPGVAYWQRWMDRGLSPQGVEVKFLSSRVRWAKSGSTNRKWLDGMYSDVLGRSATPGLLDHWEGRLNSGWSRERAATVFVLHRDHLYPLIEKQYKDMLGKSTIAAPRVNLWVNRIQKRWRFERLIAGLADTADYQNKAAGTGD